MRAFQCRPNKGRLFFVFQFTRNFLWAVTGGMQRPFEWAARLSRAERALMKKKLVSLFLTLLTILSLFPTAAFAAESTGVGITPVTDPNLWTTRLTASGQTYSYRPPTAAGRQLYCMDLGYSYRYGTESFLKSYTYRSATGTDADALWR